MYLTTINHFQNAHDLICFPFTYITILIIINNAIHFTRQWYWPIVRHFILQCHLYLSTLEEKNFLLSLKVHWHTYLRCIVSSITRTNSQINMFATYHDVFNICRITSQIAKQKVSTMMSIPDIDCTLSEYSIIQQRRLNGTYNLLFLF